MRGFRRFEPASGRTVQRGLLLYLLTLVLSIASCSSPGPAHERNGAGAERAGPHPLASAFQRLSRAATWELDEAIPLDFNTFHPQGLVRTRSHWFISSVEILERPRLDSKAVSGEPDRSEGKGRAHLFKVDPSGRLVQELALGESTRAIYHPGGMGFDGRNLWVPVAQYRPHSVSIIYRVDAQTFKAEPVFEVREHVGALVYDAERNTLHGASWGSRTFHTWDLTGKELGRWANGSHYVDYQDCQYVPTRYMLCAGMSEHSLPQLGRFALGGLGLVDLDSHRVIHEVPVLLYPQEAGPQTVMTRNPVHAEMDGSSIRFYFIPEDDRSFIYVYRVTPDVP